MWFCIVEDRLCEARQEGGRPYKLFAYATDWKSDPGSLVRLFAATL
jgi:hypothetical protein